MAAHELASTIAALLSQVGPAPLERSWAAGQAWPFLLAGLAILAVVIWAAAGGLKRRREGL